MSVVHLLQIHIWSIAVIRRDCKCKDSKDKPIQKFDGHDIIYLHNVCVLHVLRLESYLLIYQVKH